MYEYMPTWAFQTYSEYGEIQLKFLSSEWLQAAADFYLMHFIHEAWAPKKSLTEVI